MTMKAPVARINDLQAREITRQDPEPNADGTCIVCRKLRKPERSKAYAGITATLDPFCSCECARAWYGNPIPERSIWSLHHEPALEEVAARRTPHPHRQKRERPSPALSVTPPPRARRAYRSRPGSRATRIIAFLADGPKRMREIAGHVGATYPQASAQLGQLAAAGAIVRLSRGVYALPVKVLEREPQAEAHASAMPPLGADDASAHRGEPSRSDTSIVDEIEASLLADLVAEAAA